MTETLGVTSRRNDNHLSRNYTVFSFDEKTQKATEAIERQFAVVPLMNGR